ncbi:hypothetical protein [Ramlibacter sp. WS9]|uniref:hypothetical protein n=1 Tax=Ramlibacter sp. WS9 TaxID=1882741 RepID=UPI001141F320|nr:hypothetical protein [Ramlibacter sp. WS9]ROZ68587.1 hypothetical protein EEB15_25225 [Ramlibacter sp. WS9]
MQTSILRYSGHTAVTLVLAALSPCHAQMADPTRPAPAWLAAQAAKPGAEPVAEAATPEVQIFVTGPTRRFAMVDGEAIRPGDTHNGAKLVAINADGAVWQKGGVLEKTLVNSSVEKTEPGRQTPLQGSPKVQKKIVIGEGK